MMTSTTSKTWIGRGALAAMLLAITSTAALANPSAARAKKDYDAGVANMKAQDFRSALSDFKSAYQMDDQPLYHTAYCEAAVALQHPNFADDACRGLEAEARGTSVEQRAAKAIKGWNQLAAAKWAKRAEATDPRNAVAWWHKAIELDPAPAYYAGLCATYKALGQTAEAATACNEAAARSKGTKDAAKYQAEATQMAGAAAAEPTAAQQALLVVVMRAAITANSLQTEGYVQPRTLEQYVGQAKACLDAVEAAKKGGAQPSHLVKADFKIDGGVMKSQPGGGPMQYAPLANIEAMCIAKFATLRGKDAADKLAAAQRKLDLVATGKELDEADIALLTGPAEDCAVAVEQALTAYKLPASTPLKVTDKVTVKLGDANAQVCQKLVTETARVRAEWKARIEAARQAKLAPFKAAVKGDKLRIIEEEHLYEISGYGKGGVEMDSPAEYKKASLIFIVMSFEGNDGRTHWRLRRYQFRGDKLVKTTETTGRGDSPPTKAYK